VRADTCATTVIGKCYWQLFSVDATSLESPTEVTCTHLQDHSASANTTYYTLAPYLTRGH
jgi:hypothetical protein